MKLTELLQKLTPRPCWRWLVSLFVFFLFCFVFLLVVLVRIPAVEEKHCVLMAQPLLVAFGVLGRVGPSR